MQMFCTNIRVVLQLGFQAKDVLNTGSLASFRWSSLSLNNFTKILNVG